MPPYSLTKELIEKIKETYRVEEQAKLNIPDLQNGVLRLRSAIPILVVLSSLDDITEQSQLCNLKLYAFKCSEAFKNEPANNFYLNASTFYAHQNFQNASTAASVRKEVEKIIKVANSPKMIKLLNPARMHLNTEEDLMVVLQLQEPPSVDVSMDNHDEQQQTPATPLKKDPVAKAEAPAKKQAALAS